jgi:hypothetical protein
VDHQVRDWWTKYKSQGKNLQQTTNSDGGASGSRYSSANPWKEPPKAPFKKRLEMSGVQDYERHLVNSHSAHRRGWFDFHPGHVCAVEADCDTEA